MRCVDLRPPLPIITYTEAIRANGRALASAATQAGPEAKVPTCPDWTVRDLVQHLGGVHRWATSIVATPRVEPWNVDLPEVVGTWPSDADLADWLNDGADALATTLEAADPALECYTFLAATSPLAMWSRRQAHETAIHRLDAEHAVVGSGDASAVPSLVFDPELAADGIDELLTLMVPRRLRRERPEVEGTVLFHAADAGRAWLVQLKRGEIPEVGPAGDLEADASVVGTADAVYRAAWHRPSTAIITGDRDLVEALRSP
jgi:uncharacterized protein (TIGR03083 family)